METAIINDPDDNERSLATLLNV